MTRSDNTTSFNARSKKRRLGHIQVDSNNFRYPLEDGAWCYVSLAIRQHENVPTHVMFGKGSTAP